MTVQNFILFILSLVSYFSKPELSFTSTPAFRFLDWLSFDVHLEDVKYEKSSGLPDKAFLSSADEVSLWSRAPGPPGWPCPAEGLDPPNCEWGDETPSAGEEEEAEDPGAPMPEAAAPTVAASAAEAAW